MSGFAFPDTIRVRTILLLLATAILITVVNVSILLSRPPPAEPPLNTFEIARLLNRLPIAKPNPDVKVEMLLGPPDFVGSTRVDRLTAYALARDLRTPVDNIRFMQVGTLPSHFAFLRDEMETSFRLYGDRRFDALVPQGFRAAVLRPNGQWEAISRLKSDKVSDWRDSIIARFVLSLLLMLPIGSMFARWLTEPIQVFGAAAERLGRERRVEHVEVRGPAEIRQAARALNEMQDRIQGYVIERTSVIGAIAHDLRTPLSRLQFRLALVPDEIRLKAEGDIDEMEQLIAGSLELAEVEAQTRIRERVDLSLLIEGVVDDLSALGRNVKLVETSNATVVGDPLLLRRMMTNLINNAVSYGKLAAVTMTAQDREAIVDVDDDGPGLDRDQLARAFQPFYRGEPSRNRSTGGTGLGLAIVKAAVTAHGGDIELLNRPEGGLRARIRLPLADEPDGSVSSQT